MPSGKLTTLPTKPERYQFESLHKIYFYDAWRWKIELNQPESPLRLPPRPGLLQNGCYWQQLHAHPADAAHTRNTQDSAALAEISLSETSSDASAEPAPPTEVPEPVSPETNESPTSPITIGSAEEEHDGPQPNATEPSEEATPAATIASTSEVDKAQERRTGTVASPDTSAAAFVVEQREQSEGEHAEETESGTTDEVIDLDDSPEAIPAHPARSPSEGVMVKRAMVVTRVAALLHLLRIPAPSTSLQRRRRGEIDGDQACQLSQEPLPHGVDPDSKPSLSPTSPAEPENRRTMEDPAPHVALRPKRQGPLAVKSKAAKPAADQQKRAPGQGLIEAIHSRLHTSPMPATGLLSIAAARPPMTGVANPQMPATPPEDPGPHTPTKEDAPTKELYLHETEDQAGSVNADITHLAEQRGHANGASIPNTISRGRCQHKCRSCRVTRGPAPRWRLRSACTLICRRNGP